MINFIKKRKKTSPGFTLVETLVALFIFSVSILTVMSALSQGISSTTYAKNKIVAEYLSQEGIEYFRNIRDTTMLYATDKPQAWSVFIGKLSVCETTGCYFNNDEDNIPNPITGIPIISCDGTQCPNFFYDSSSGKYIQNGGSGNTSFSRKMTIERATDNESLKIISEVTFSAGSGTGTVSLSENLSDWIE